MALYLVTDEELEESADSIRTKTGSPSLVPWVSGKGFKAAIAAIPTGGGYTGKIINYIELTPTTNLTEDNRADIQLDKTVKSAMVVIPRVYPVTQNSYYQPILWASISTAPSYTSADYSVYAVLRPTGSSGIGTDSRMCTYNASTGILSIGGRYATFEAGKTYDIYQIAYE